MLVSGFLVALLLQAADPLASERDRMVKEQIESRGVRLPAVLRAMRATPRHLFMPDNVRPLAYADRPLPDLAAVHGVIIQKAVPGRRRLSRRYI